jgi:hypothetical protein
MKNELNSGQHTFNIEPYHGKIIWERGEPEPQLPTPEEEHLARLDKVRIAIRELAIHPLHKGAMEYYLDKK